MFGRIVIIALFALDMAGRALASANAQRETWAKFRRQIPIVKEVKAHEIQLDMDWSLIHFPEATDVEVQYLEGHQESWQKLNYSRSQGPLFSIGNLKQQTRYKIRFAWNPGRHESVLSGEKEQSTNPCISIGKNVVDLKFEAPSTIVARLRDETLEAADLCQLKEIRVFENEMMLLNEIELNWRVEWKLPPCRPGSDFIFRLEDHQGGVVQNHGTCLVPAAPPDENDTSPSANDTESTIETSAARGVDTKNVFQRIWFWLFS